MAKVHKQYSSVVITKVNDFKRVECEISERINIAKEAGLMGLASYKVNGQDEIYPILRKEARKEIDFNFLIFPSSRSGTRIPI